MELSYMLNQMCHSGLSEADIKAICKARGFNQKQTTSRSIFESFYLSSVGLRTVMGDLSPGEVALLYLLNHRKEEVDITFFERLYGSGRNYYSGTFTQQFKETLDAVKKALVRRGILVMAEAKVRGDSVQMQRWRFRFPAEFAEFLPPLIQSPHVSDALGEIKSDVARSRLVEAIEQRGDSTLIAHSQYHLRLEQGSLRMNNHDFRSGDLTEWQQAAWDADMAVIVPNNRIVLAPVAAFQMILNTLGSGEWALPEQIEPILEIFCFGIKLPSVAKICKAGWKWGCLARLFENGQTFYRLPMSGQIVPSASLDSEPSTYLRSHLSGDSVIVNLRLIPFDMLEQLNRLARLEIQDKILIARPDLVKSGRATPEERQLPLGGWLCSHFSAFQQAFDAVENRWGKTILHSGLLLARVRDLSLRVQLQRELGEYLVVLENEYVAFPRAWRSEVEKVLKKGGFVIKEVRL